MKTFFKTKTDYRWALEKRCWFEERTGVKWDYFGAAGGMKFTPVISKRTEPDAEAGEKVREVLKGLGWHEKKFGIGFIALSETSGMDIKDVLAGARWLIKEVEASGSVNRMGHCAGIRLKE